jgi:hypothetical protein
MPRRRTSRREVIAAGAALPIFGQSSATGYKPKVFTAAELTQLRDLAEAIIPRTETPGAADAKVQLYIDRVMSAKPAGEVAAFRKGLAEAVKQGIPALAAAQHPFFKQLKDLTIDGYYSSKEGLAQELGWHGYTPLHHFDGCTHPEHKG